jgi:hypothetical protein
MSGSLNSVSSERCLPRVAVAGDFAGIGAIAVVIVVVDS